VKDFSDTQPTSHYAVAIGKKSQAFYVDKFEGFDHQGPGFHASWNWAAFFFTGFWALYRKMYGWAFLWLGAFIVFGVLGRNPPNLSNRAAFWLLATNLALVVAFAAYANCLYHRSVSARIVAAQRSTSDGSEVRGRLSARSGVHVWVPIVFAGIPVIGLVAAIALPAYQDFTRRQTFPAGPLGADQAQQEVRTTSESPPPVGPYGKNDVEVAPISAAPSNADDWSGNPFNRFDSVSEIETRARRFHGLNEQRAWAAVIAWQASNMAESKIEANEALYSAVGTVLGGLRDNKGICRPGPVVVVDAASASPAFPVGTRLVMLECDR
jgi:hypothetical protein